VGNWLQNEVRSRGRDEIAFYLVGGIAAGRELGLAREDLSVFSGGVFGAELRKTLYRAGPEIPGQLKGTGHRQGADGRPNAWRWTNGQEPREKRRAREGAAVGIVHCFGRMFKLTRGAKDCQAYWSV